MPFLEDPITGDVATRVQTEEEEEQAQQLVSQYLVEPTFNLEASGLQGGCVVFLLGPAAALLATTLFRRAQAVGSITVPELQRLRSPYEEEYIALPAVHASQVLRLGDSLTLVASDKAMPAEQAATWAAAVVGTLQPARAVVASAIAAMEYRGPGSPADEDLIFSLQSSAMAAPPQAAAAAAAAQEGVGVIKGSKGSSGGSITGGQGEQQASPPELPTGTLLGGLPAALLGLFERQDLPATAVVGVQLSPAPDAKFVCSLAGGVLAVLAGQGAGEVLQGLPSQGELLPEVKAATDRVYRSSASNSMYI